MAPQTGRGVVESVGMTMANPAEAQVSIEAYLQAEEVALEKHEYHDGVVVAMSGGSLNHCAITVNFGGEVRAALKGKPCRAFDSNLHVAIGTGAKFVYPDLTVICGHPEFDPRQGNRQRIVSNPKLIVEVLSPSTAGYDRGRKFELYREIASLEEYVLVSQDAAMVEVFQRLEDGGWRFDVSRGLGAVVRLRSLEIEIPLAEIYAGVEFSAEEHGAMEPEK